MSAQRPCSCGSGLESYPLHDAQRIYIQRVCAKCEAAVKRRYRPEILRGYTQADVDESIESED
jgi:cbb3-type cytochrome oxidase cytochrome c subunit